MNLSAGSRGYILVRTAMRVASKKRMLWHDAGVFLLLQGIATLRSEIWLGVFA